MKKTIQTIRLGQESLVRQAMENKISNTVT